MKRIWINFWVDLGMFLCMLFLAVSGLVQKYVLPPARGSRRGLGPEELMGWTRHDWGDLHFYLSVAIVVLLIVHVVLHWTWIVCRIKALFKINDKPAAACETQPD